MTSTSASQPPKLSAAGWTTITVLAILANPRIVPASRTFVLDAQFYVGPTNVHEGNTSGSQAHLDLPTFTIDPCKRPYVKVTGVAMELSKDQATFEVNVEQYISSFKSNTPTTPQAGGSRFKPTTRFFCHIPDSPKYKSWGSKPLPGNKR